MAREAREDAEAVPFTALVVGAVVTSVAGVAMWRSARPWTLVLDTGSIHLGQTLSAFRTWMTGRVPEWSDLIWGGFPILSDCTNAVLYPLHFLAYAATLSAPLRFFDAAMAIHLGVLAAGSVALLRVLGARPGAATFGGVLAALCPFTHYCAIAFFVVFGAQAWWPWAFTAAELLARPGAPVLGAAMVLGWLALAAQVLVGFPENAAYCAVVMAAWVLTRHSEVPLGARVWRLVILGLGAAALAAPQAVATAFFLPATIRGEAPPVPELASLWMSDPARLVVAGRGVMGVPSFLGLGALALAAVSVIARRPRAMFLLVVAVLGLALAMGPQAGVYEWLNRVPVFDRFRSPIKLFALTELAVVWMAALGADALWRSGKGAPWAVGSLLVLGSLTERAVYLPTEINAFREITVSDGIDPELVQLLASSLPVRSQQPGRPPALVLDMGSTVSGGYMRSVGAAVGLSSLRAGTFALLTPTHLRLVNGKWPSTVLGVRYAIAPRDRCPEVIERLPWRLAEQTQAYCVLENPARPEHFAFVTRPRVLGSIGEMIAAVRANRNGPIPVVAAPEAVAGLKPGGAIVRSYEAGHAVLTTSSMGRSLLLVRDSWLPGWTVHVDGVETMPYPAAGLYFAVPLERGTHRVELRYRAPGFRAGLLIAAVWSAGTVAWVLSTRRRRYASP